MTDSTSPTDEWSESPHEPRDRQPDPPPLDVLSDPDAGTVTFATADGATEGAADGEWITVDADDVVALDETQ